MRRWSSVLLALCLMGIMAAPAAAVDVGEFLSVTGFIDNHMRYIDNVSTNEEANRGLLQTDEDEVWQARTRGRIFFTAKPNAFSKAVVAFEMDQTWGQSNSTSAGGGGIGFDLGIDNVAVELKHLYAQVKIPSTPIKVTAGGFSVSVTKLKSCMIYCDDSGGIVVEGAWSPQFSTYSWFVIAEEEQIEDNTATGGDAFGED